MKSGQPKVLHEVCGRPLIDYVLNAARQAGVARILVVVGHRADLVQAHLHNQTDVSCVLQAQQLGTGHAVMMCREHLQSHSGPVLILAGDTPLIRPESLRKLVELQQQEQASCVIGTAHTADNQGLGRIVRTPSGAFMAIVEEKDATEEQRRITEINTGCYAFDTPALLESLLALRPENAQSEYYLTDCPRILLSRGANVLAASVFQAREALGVNTRVQLAEVASEIQREIQQRWMLAGVTIVQPTQTYIDAQVDLGIDSVLEPFTVIKGPVQIGAGCHIGPHAVLQGPLTLPPGSVVGPFQHLRGT